MSTWWNCKWHITNVIFCVTMHSDMCEQNGLWIESSCSHDNKPPRTGLNPLKINVALWHLVPFERIKCCERRIKNYMSVKTGEQPSKIHRISNWVVMGMCNTLKVWFSNKKFRGMLESSQIFAVEYGLSHRQRGFYVWIVKISAFRAAALQQNIMLQKYYIYMCVCLYLRVRGDIWWPTKAFITIDL